MLLLASGHHRTTSNGLHLTAGSRLLGRLRFQLPLGFLLVVCIPTLIYHGGDAVAALHNLASFSTLVGTTIAFLIALFLFRRVISFPGIGIVAHVLPATAAGYGLTLAVYLGLRLFYSGVTLLLSFATCVGFLLLVSSSLRSTRGRHFYAVPSPAALEQPEGHHGWSVLRQPALPRDPHLVLIADLHADLGAEWEALIAEAAVNGHPVYHIKQVRESLTGKVNIEHLSENSFGSLIPNLSYRKIKRLIDLVSVVALAPILLLIGTAIAFVVKLDSPGPVFFIQHRRGYRGRTFRMIKFRTMTHRDSAGDDARAAAITVAGDQRVTRVGRFLRRCRLDELPQVWNVLLGEMSWIGPRPEALALSAWYRDQLPFYAYRHIVRPGITGWAQVNQGHVADLEGVFDKLQYDFYYIKNYSAWLDLLIVWRTGFTMLSGFGAR